MLSWLFWTLIELIIIAVLLYVGAVYLARTLRKNGYTAQAATIESWLEKLG